MFEEHNWNESVAVAVAVALLHLAFRNNILAASRSFIFPSSNDSFDDFQRTPRIHKQNVCNEISMYFQHHLDEHFTHAIEFLYGFWFTNEVFWKRFDCFGENISCVNADVLINRCRTQKASWANGVYGFVWNSSSRRWRAAKTKWRKVLSASKWLRQTFSHVRAAKAIYWHSQASKTI